MPGQEAVLDRLLDLLLIAALRTWFARPEPTPRPGTARTATRWSGRRCGCCSTSPAEPWTVAKLAANVGVSRAALARRFTGRSASRRWRYLTGWRLALAADLLRQHPDATIGAVAHQVGYGSSFALSTAFKREYGVSPQAYRNGLSQPPAHRVLMGSGR